MQLHIFADKRDANRFCAAVDFLYKLLPLAEIAALCVNIELAAHNVGKSRFLKHERSFVQYGNGHVFDNAVRLNIAEMSNFFEYALILNMLIAAQNDDVRRNSHSLKLLDRVLRGL